MAKINRKCTICGNEYSFCEYGCTKDLSKPEWTALFDSNNCRDIYYACTNYIVGRSTKAQAQKRLKKLNLTNIENYNPVVKGWIEEITGNIKASEDDYAIPQEEQAEG